MRWWRDVRVSELSLGYDRNKASVQVRDGKSKKLSILLKMIEKVK